MPFRTYFASVEPGQAKPVYKYKAGDVEVTITTQSLPGQSQSPSGYNFCVGGPELGENGGGLYIMSSSFTTQVEDEDELWVSVPAGELAWTAQGIPLTVWVRSHKAKAQAEKASKASGDGQGVSVPDSKEDA